MIVLGTSCEDIKKAALILKNGGLVAFPTETVYGLGADAFNKNALAGIFEVKGRPRFDPLIIHIADPETLERIAYLDSFGPHNMEQLKLLVDSFWPGPLTLVLPKRSEVPDLATAGLPAVAVRFPSHPAACSLIEQSTGAVAAPSANPFGRISPSRAEHVIETLGNSIDCIIDGGPCSVGVESTVLELIPLPRILRHGGISREQLEAVIGPVEAGTADIKCDQNKQSLGDLMHEQSGAPSPGMMKNHYAPQIPLFLHTQEEMARVPYNPKEAYLFFSGKNRDAWLGRVFRGQLPNNYPEEKILTLSEKGTAAEAAANLFELLHILDKSGAVCIHAETVPDDGIGRAVNDRLQRASAG